MLDGTGDVLLRPTDRGDDVLALRQIHGDGRSEALVNVRRWAGPAAVLAPADRIIVMDAGRIGAIGSHADLLATNSLYAELAATQYLATVRSNGA